MPDNQGPQERPRDADVARQAAIQSLVSNLVYLLIIVGFSVAVTRRDAISRLAARLRAWGEDRPPPGYGAALHELRRDIARLEGREVP